MQTVLSFKDEYVSEGYIPLYTLLTQKKYAPPQFDNWCISEAKYRELRYKTYQETYKRFKVANLKSYAKFWNFNLEEINSLGLNEFNRQIKYRELSNVIICFETIVENKNALKGYEGKRRLISFGIRKNLYEKYCDYQRKLLNGETNLKPLKLHDTHKNGRTNIVNYKKKHINLSEDVKFSVFENELYLQFETWCKIKGLSKKQAFSKAIDLLMKQEPINEMKDRKLFYNKIDIDNERSLELIIENQIPQEQEYKDVRIKMLASVYRQTRLIIARFNTDIENQAKEPLRFETYVAQAIMHLNKNSPLKYRDPEAYKTAENLKKIAEYNASIK